MFSATAAATEDEAGEGLSFDEALGLAPRHPRVEASRGASEEKRARDGEVSRLSLNPQVAVQPGFRLAPRGARAPELVAEILQPWNLSGHGSARREAIAWEERALAASERATLLEQRLAVAEAWTDAWRARRAWDDAEKQTALATSLSALVQKASALGAATAADVAEAEAFAAEVAMQALGAEGEVVTRGVALRRLVAIEGAGPLATRGALPSPVLPPSASEAAALAAVGRLPMVAQARLVARAQRARAVEETAARGSWLALGGVVQRDAPRGLVLSVAGRFTPALWDHGARERGQLDADARLKEGDARGAELDARAAISLAFHEVEHTREVRALLDERLRPSVERAAAGRRKLFEMGRATLPEVLLAERRAIAAATETRQAEADHAWAKVKLWLLLASLVPEVTP